MVTLASETYTREGNDCQLSDTIEIISDDGVIILRHTSKVDGSWTGHHRYVRDVEIDGDNVKEIRNKISEHLKNIALFDFLNFDETFGIKD